MMHRTLSIVMIAFISAGLLNAQEWIDTTYRNAAKINIAAGIFKNISVYYERQFNSHWSAQLGAGYKVAGNIPEILGVSHLVITSETNGIRGWSLSPEARYHFKQCDCDPRTGLYLGAYGKVTHFEGQLVFNYWDGIKYFDVGGAGDLQEYGIGLQLGYQFVFKDRWLVDLMFMGPRTSFQRLKLRLDSDFASEVIPLIEEEINKRLAWFGMDPISIPTDPSASIDFRFNNFRYGVSIGFLL